MLTSRPEALVRAPTRTNTQTTTNALATGHVKSDPKRDQSLPSLKGGESSALLHEEKLHSSP